MKEIVGWRENKKINKLRIIKTEINLITESKIDGYKKLQVKKT